MTIFKNIFGNCFSNTNNHDDCMDKINKLEMRINILEREIFMDMKRIEDKIDIKFDLMNQKIDNILMIVRK